MIENLTAEKLNAAGFGKGVGIAGVVLATSVLVVILNEAVHKIPVSIPRKCVE